MYDMRHFNERTAWLKCGLKPPCSLAMVYVERQMECRSLAMVYVERQMECPQFSFEIVARIGLCSTEYPVLKGMHLSSWLF